MRKFPEGKCCLGIVQLAAEEVAGMKEPVQALEAVGGN